MGVYSIVDNRAWHSLKIVTDEFNKFTSIKTRENNRIELNGEKLGLSSIYSSYKVINKWMGRIYHFKWHCSFEDHQTTSEQTITLKYSGTLFGQKQPKFFCKSNDIVASILNHDKEIIDICSIIDFEKLELKYSKRDHSWHIEFWPNYGDFIWMLIPPVRYFRKPNSEEINKTIELVQRIRSLIKKELV